MLLMRNLRGPMLFRQDAIIWDFDLLPLGRWWLLILFLLGLSGSWNLGGRLFRLGLGIFGSCLFFTFLLLLGNLFIDGLISSESELQEPEHVCEEWQRF